MSIFCTTIYTAKLHTSCHDSFTCQPRQIQPHSMICAIVAYAVNNGNHAVNCRPAGTCFFAQRVLLPNYGRHASLHSKCWHIAIIFARTHYNQSECSSLAIKKFSTRLEFRVFNYNWQQWHVFFYPSQNLASHQQDRDTTERALTSVRSKERNYTHVLITLNYVLPTCYDQDAYPFHIVPCTVARALAT